MPKLEKLTERLLSRPKDYAWSELQSLLKRLGYLEIQGSGSRVRFIHAKSKHKIFLHRPHPNPELPVYAVDQVIERLKEQGYL